MADDPETWRGSTVETADPTLVVTESTALSDGLVPNPKSTKTLTSRVLKLLGRPVEELQRRPERVQFKIDQDKSSKLGRKSKKTKKTSKFKKRVQKKKARAADDQDQSGTEAPTGQTDNAGASTSCNIDSEENAGAGMDYDEELTATCPTVDEQISRHSLVGLENQSMLLIGGYDYGNGGASQSGIWQLKYVNWNKIGELLQADHSGSAIYIGRSIYYFGYNSKAIERLDFTEETEELQNVARIGNQPGYYYLPVLFQTVPNYCV
ncbi:unnamed protein product [Oikopleura dioica]|uniref:Uncharacterized protein n=1 Tax=Oikopleura dioica TaxID=34765 RepID=E4XV40_OIKDI|nr:unnamed protein product [Oikopleura dioica]